MQGLVGRSVGHSSLVVRPLAFALKLHVLEDMLLANDQRPRTDDALTVYPTCPGCSKSGSARQDIGRQIRQGAAEKASML